MTPKELEDDIVSKLQVIELRYTKALLDRNDAIQAAESTFYVEKSGLEYERLRVLMQHTVRAMTELK